MNKQPFQWHSLKVFIAALCSAAIMLPSASALDFTMSESYQQAQNHDIKAMRQMAKLYQHQSSTILQRQFWLTQLADKGDIEATYQLCNDVNLNAGSAFSWCLKAAKANYAPAFVALADRYNFAAGVERSNAHALYWYQLGADAGLAPAQYQLAMAYQNGDFLPQDSQLAFDLFLKAAEQGYDKAQLRLGEMLLYGQGINQDYTQAMIYLQQAAHSGNVQAQFSLGVMKYQGLGQTPDTVLGFAWASLAHQQLSGFEQRQKNRQLNEMKRALSPGQMTAAKKVLTELSQEYIL
ncbi:tetratricopeptide repeat protein [Motilimonas pumila]|uniref:Sel1 repeat family protein n=1 Tax=Motilimonas pumila TaxID=2303987 RepID=A0A418YFK1_9GAMM|nr:tetratricopeptide repeat protein [Motilimonas pumila]RJG48150.1 sel1 repeat family protein [Motilimonas pumila]